MEMVGDREEIVTSYSNSFSNCPMYSRFILKYKNWIIIRRIRYLRIEENFL